MIDTSLFVVDKIQDMEIPLNIMEEYSDVLCSIRIKAASNLWHENKAKEKIFVSDMLKYLVNRGPTELREDGKNFTSTTFCNTVHNGNVVMLVSWYDVNNVDLLEINCPPWYKGPDGQLDNFVIASLFKERDARLSCGA